MQSERQTRALGPKLDGTRVTEPRMVFHPGERSWALSGARANFPMGLDETNHRLFVGFRQPAKLIVFDTESGRSVVSLESVGDADDIFYDRQRKRIYVAGGEVPDCELGHHGSECSFDAILRKYQLDDPALVELAKIVRAADTADKSWATEGAGLEAIADGFRA